MRFLYMMSLPAIYKVTAVYTAPIDNSNDTEIIGLRLIDKTANRCFEDRVDVRDIKYRIDEDDMFYTDGHSVIDAIGGVVAVSEDQGDLVGFGKLGKILPIGTKVVEGIVDHITITRGAAMKMLKKHHGWPSKNFWFDGAVNERTYQRCMDWIQEGARIVLLETNEANDNCQDMSDEEIAWKEEHMR